MEVGRTLAVMYGVGTRALLDDVVLVAAGWGTKTIHPPNISY